MKGALGLELPAFPKSKQPKKWPANAVFFEGACAWKNGQCVGLFETSPVSKAARLFQLPKDHPANSDGTGLGVKSRRDIVSGNLIGYYACEVYDELEDDHNGYDPKEEDLPFNQYIMSPHDESSTLIYDAQYVGNTLRFINDVRGVASHPNVQMGKCVRFKNAPEWVSIRPIYAIASIKKGEELLLDYGDQYWKSLNINTNFRTCLECKSVLLKDITHFCRRGRGFSQKCRPCEVKKRERSMDEPPIEVKIRKTNSETTLEVDSKCDSVDTFRVNEFVEVKHFENDWRRARIIAARDSSEFCTIEYVTSFKKISTIALVSTSSLRKATVSC